MVASLMEKAKKAKISSEVESQRKRNREWILVNKEDLLGNFPSRWIAVDNEAIQLVDQDLFVLYRNIRNRGQADSVVYFFVNNFEPPLMVETPVELEYEWNTSAGWIS